MKKSKESLSQSVIALMGISGFILMLVAIFCYLMTHLGSFFNFFNGISYFVKERPIFSMLLFGFLMTVFALLFSDDDKRNDC